MIQQKYKVLGNAGNRCERCDRVKRPLGKKQTAIWAKCMQETVTRVLADEPYFNLVRCFYTIRKESLYFMKVECAKSGDKSFIVLVYSLFIMVVSIYLTPTLSLICVL